MCRIEHVSTIVGGCAGTIQLSVVLVLSPHTISAWGLN